MNGTRRIGVGIVGVHPSRGWAGMAHIPALRALPEYTIAALSHPDPSTAAAAAAKFGVPRAYASARDLLRCPAVDLVIVTVKVPRHYELVSMAIEAGKSVFCEWPLGNGSAEASALEHLARQRDCRTFIGLQSRESAELLYMRDLVRSGYVGEVLSATLIGSGIIGGADVPEAFVYALDPVNGAGVLNVAFAHAVDSACFALGGAIKHLNATLGQRRTHARVSETGESVRMRTPDQITMTAQMDSGAVVSAHVRGGLSRATNFHLEINGTAGDLVLTGSLGYPGVGTSSLRGATGAEPVLRDLPVPTQYADASGTADPAENVRRQYVTIAHDLNSGETTAPTFADAVALHRIVAAVEQSAETGCRQLL